MQVLLGHDGDREVQVEQTNINVHVTRCLNPAQLTSDLYNKKQPFATTKNEQQTQQAHLLDFDEKI